MCIRDSVYPAALIDVKSAIRYFKENAEKYAVDADNIFIAGESAGATLAALTGVTGKTDCGMEDSDNGNEVRGVIDFYGVVAVSYTHLDVYKRQEGRVNRCIK